MLVHDACTCAESEEQKEGCETRNQQSKAAQASSRSSSQREQLSQAVDTAILKVSSHGMCGLCGAPQQGKPVQQQACRFRRFLSQGMVAFLGNVCST